MDAVIQDLRYALRSLAGRPAHAAAVVATWALGLGAAVAVFAVAWGVLWKPLPYADPERLVVVWQTDLHNESDSERASVPDLRDYQARSRSFDGLAGVSTQPMNLKSGPGGEIERVATAGISHRLPAMLGRGPVLGRSFTAGEDRPGAPAVALVSHELWRTRFGGDPGAVGSVVSLDEVPTEVVGVLPDDFDLPFAETQVWRPFSATVSELAEQRGVHGTLIFGRLADGVTLEAAQSEMTAIAKRLEAEYPADNVGRGVRIEPLREAVAGDARPSLLVLLGAVLLLLVIAGANAGALVLSRGLARTRELGIRSVLGAARGRLVRQILLESVVLAVASGAAGVALAAGALAVLRASSMAGLGALPRADSLAIDPRVLGFAVVLTLAVGALSGLMPALRLSRRGLAGAAGGAAGRVTADPRVRRTRGALVVGQIALAVVLTVGAGLLGRSLWSLLSVDPGFDPEGVLVAEVNLPTSRYPAPRSAYPNLPEVLGFYDRALPRLAAIPGVERVSLAANHPMQRGWTSRVEAEGYEPPPGPPDESTIRAVAPGYFEAAGIDLLRGRGPTAADRSSAQPVLVVNQAFADQYFAGRDPLGRTASFWGVDRTIVGVVGNVRFAGLGEPVEPAVYPPLHQVPMTQLQLVVKSSRSPTELAREVRSAIAEVDADLALSGVRTLEEAVAETLGRPRFQLSLMTTYALLALALAAIGVYGLVAGAVAERTREIGLRMALGADRGRVLRLVLGTGALLAAAGVAVGLWSAALLTRLAESLLHGVEPFDPATYAAVGVALMAVALAAAWWPARRATRVDPVTALRSE